MHGWFDLRCRHLEICRVPAAAFIYCRSQIDPQNWPDYMTTIILIITAVRRHNVGRLRWHNVYSKANNITDTAIPNHPRIYTQILVPSTLINPPHGSGSKLFS